MFCACQYIILKDQSIRIYVHKGCREDFKEIILIVNVEMPSGIRMWGS